MGLPALKREPRRQPASPRLRVVAPGERRPRTGARRGTSTSRAPRTAGRQAFRIFAVCMAVLAAVGVGRVALTAAAAQTSLDSAKLRKEIKAARYEGDMLEVQQSALSAPSRIRQIADSKLSLGEPVSVSYIGMQTPRPAAKSAAKPKSKPAGPGKAPNPVSGTASRPAGIGAVVSNVMHVAAGEARILMVGDVGLASSW